MPDSLHYCLDDYGTAFQRHHTGLYIPKDAFLFVKAVAGNRSCVIHATHREHEAKKHSNFLVFLVFLSVHLFSFTV